MVKRIIALIIVLALILVTPGFAPTADAAVETVPETLNGVSYQYNSRIKFLDLSVATGTESGVKIPGTSLAAGDVLVDRENQRSLKILKVNPDGTYLTTKPTMAELFSEFTIPHQVILPNAANITDYTVKGISVAQYISQSNSGESTKIMSGTNSTLMNQIYGIFSDRGSRIYEYDGVYEFTPFGKPGSGKVKLSLSGAIGVSPGIVAEYSLFDGYEFGFVNAAQFIDLNIMFDVAIQEELYLPVFAVNVPIAGLGNVRMGVFLVVDMDGNITLTIRAEEGIVANASVYGKTKFGIPTSFHVNTGFDKYFGAECDPMGYIHAGLYITPLVGLEILDVDVFGAQLRLGLYGYADITDTTMNYGVDFVVNAFVTIMDDRTNLINIQIPIIERNKSFRASDDVIFYFSRLCVYQDRINIAAMTKRLAGTSAPNALPFSDKLPFANRDLEIWYYRNGNDPLGGQNQNPDLKIPLKTDANGCISLDLANFLNYVPASQYNTLSAALKNLGYTNGIDVQRGDSIKIRAPGFQGETDLIQSVTPFGRSKEPGQSDFYGNSKIRGDFFEDTVEFTTLSGPDLTVLDVPNTEVQFDTAKRIYYEGDVTVYSTDISTKATEKATFSAKRDITEYSLKKTGYFVTSLMGDMGNYNIKPNNELRWQINVDGFVYGTYESTGAGGWATEHHVFVRRMTEDQQVAIEDLNGNTIGIQHNVLLRVVAVNKGGSRAYKASAKIYYALGAVPVDFVQGLLPIQDLGYVKFPAANMRYPNHFEYYPDNPFPVLLYEKKDAPDLQIGAADVYSTSEGTFTSGEYRWRWEEIKPGVPETMSVQEINITQDATGAPVSRAETVVKTNRVYILPAGTDISAFSGIPISYTVTSESAGESIIEENGNTAGVRDIFAMRHIVSGLTLEGIPLENPPYSPPAPIIYNLDELTDEDLSVFDIEFQMELMKNHSDRFVVSPLDESIMGQYKASPAVYRNTSVRAPVTIRNTAALPKWAAGYIAATVNNGILRLDAQGNFPAGKYTTRAEFSAAIVNALGLTALDTVKTGFPFTDVKADDPNLTGMKIAYQCGIINGTSATTFQPGALITRQDAAAMLMRAFGLGNKRLIPMNTTGTLALFSDRATVSAYAVTTLEQAVRLGFFNGYTDGTFLPKNNITNEQTAKITWELKLKAETPGAQWTC
ncbi:S-layer homology domain-containing protein [Papillibacter cinnamivorans]|uniref:S-layer homology domain-containing protein n=1 Tax=Papillibacter cinnamivorans DSM 12816 TaxID=1122930 RepID=A0A1W1YDG5_9FIRM|nr:S-layer homology domain-containing protein [Papillibacter cinnamivorans]SMC34179.1 S-layer homology domain-containing protein [Papillibacter cinnamivorans DSM 12816]